jgi:hypothetical protein
VLCDRFQVTQLKELAARVLKENLRIDNVCSVLVKADMHNATDLKSAAIAFIVDNSSTILTSSQWELLLGHTKLVTDVCISLSEPLSKRFKTI